MKGNAGLRNWFAAVYMGVGSTLFFAFAKIGSLHLCHGTTTL
jgi:hypothetical protein